MKCHRGCLTLGLSFQKWTISFLRSASAHRKQFLWLAFYPSHTLDFDAMCAVTEMHDRMIVADARRTNATLLTRDAQIASSGVVATVW